MSASLSYKYFGEKNNLIFNVSDLGFIHWNNLLGYQATKKYHFDGIGITDIFNFDENVFNSVNLSSVESILGVTAARNDAVIATPATLSIDYLRMNGKLGYGGGAKQLLFINYQPKIYIRSTYQLSDKWWGAATISHGGFGGFDYEIAVGGQLIKAMFMSVNLHYAEWLIAPSYTSGQGIDLVISKFF
jgi:hypothetical protein